MGIGGRDVAKGLVARGWGALGDQEKIGSGMEQWVVHSGCTGNAEREEAVVSVE